MGKIINKLDNFSNKIGKQNFVLLVFILLVVVVSGLYQTFSLYTELKGVSVIDGIETYKFILNAENSTNSITIASNSNKMVDITINNSTNSELAYGIYYGPVNSLTGVSVTSPSDAKTDTKGIIAGKSDKIITVEVVNDTASDVTVTFGLKYGFAKGGELSLDTNQAWVGKIQLLSKLAPGSYVKYVGNNGCSGKACEGQNANYVSDTDMGYCFSSSNKFTVNGWRIAYIDDNTAYLVSAGSPECLCTDSSGNPSNSSCSTNESTTGLPKHLSNLNNAALKYCNSTYAYGGACNSSSAWSMNATDFEKVVGKVLSSASCYNSSNDTSCGYENDLIDNGGYYWFATPFGASSNYTFIWYPYDRIVHYNGYSNYLYGGRPILRLKSSVAVTGGDGTYANPYTISSS